MSHGHDHAGGPAHGATHGHGAAATGSHGPAEIPPAPAKRSITPSPEDFENLPGPSALVWPVLWMGLAVLLGASLLCGGWPVFHDEHGEPAQGVETHR